MKYLLRSGALALFLIAAQPAIASNPAVDGEISGIEVCIKSICGTAIFTGTCDCTVRGREAPGFFWVTVEYDELPDVNQAAAITAGKWTLATLRGRFSGRVIGGTIINNGDNTYDISAVLRVQKGGSGRMIAEGMLDHNEPVPTFEGELRQP